MRVVVSPAYSRLRSFVGELPATFDSQGTLVFSKRNTIKLFLVDGLRVIVKRYKRPNLVQRVAYTWFKPSKAERAYRYAARFRRCGIDTPREIGYVECRRAGLVADTFFVSLCCDDISAAVLLADGIAGERQQMLCRAIGRHLAAMHEAGIVHGDLNLSNILCRESDGWHFSLIDNDRATFCRPDTDRCLADLMRLSHKRDILLCIASYYVSERGWDDSSWRDRLLHKLDVFETRKDLKKLFKRCLHP